MPVLGQTSDSLRRGGPVGRAILDRETIHSTRPCSTLNPIFPTLRPAGSPWEFGTALIAPLLREGVAIGAIYIRRTEVRPFTEKQIEFLRPSPHQAVIAIENVRLFKELQQRNRDLTEALEQQTATGDVLRVIASSPPSFHLCSIRCSPMR